jgi:hypothetical protein
MFDRGKRDNMRTLEDMGLDPNDPNVGFIHAAGREGVQSIISEIERRAVTPKLVFVEGLDALSGDATDGKIVPQFVSYLNKVADHFNCAIVGTVGSPKRKVGEGYMAKRDLCFGSQYWGRLTQTIVMIELFNGDDMSDKRVVSVLPRRGKPEAFKMKFTGAGQLIVDATVDPSREDVERAATRKSCSSVRA